MAKPPQAILQEFFVDIPIISELIEFAREPVRSFDRLLRVGKPDREDVRFSNLTSRLLYDAGIVHDESRYRKVTIEPQVPARQQFSPLADAWNVTF